MKHSPQPVHPENKRPFRRLAAALLSAALLCLPAPALAEGELRLYNWFEYIPQELLDKFAAEHNVEVTQDTYDSNEALLARLKSGVTGYDIAVPGDYMVAILIAEGLLEEVRPDQLSNFKNVAPEWADVYFDPGRRFSVPYQWGSTSFQVDTSVYDGDIDTLKVLFDPPPELRGKVNMFKSHDEVVKLALFYLGLPQCNENPEDLKKLRDLLTAQKPHVLSYNTDGAKEVLVSGDAAAGMNFNGFGMKARLEKPTLKYAFPREGMVGWQDNLVVPKGAPNIENAKLFMNFLMDPENQAALTNFTKYTSPLKADLVAPHLDSELTSAPELNPPPHAKAEFVPPCSKEVTRLYDRIWTDLLK